MITNQAIDDAEDDWEKEREEYITNNKKLLKEFREWLSDKNIKSETINKHIRNIDLYINTFLLYEDNYPAESGVYGGSVSEFLGYFFIRKCMWASKSSIKNNASSLKKFYSFMLDKNMVTKEELKEMEQEINENMDIYLERLRKYDDHDEEEWFL